MTKFGPKMEEPARVEGPRRQCSVCKVWSDEGPYGVNMTTFPADPARRKKWLQALQLPEFNGKSEKELSTSTYICYQHFTERELIRIDGQVKVIKDGLPKIQIVRKLVDLPRPEDGCDVSDFDSHEDDMPVWNSSDPNITDVQTKSDSQSQDSRQVTETSQMVELPSVCDYVQKHKSIFYDESVLARLVHVMEETVFCSLCLSTDESSLSPLDAANHYALWRSEDELSYMQMLVQVFGSEIKHILPTQYICETCFQSVTEAYLFIHKTKTTFQVLNYYIKDIERTVDALEGNLKNPNHKEQVIDKATIVPQTCRDINKVKKINTIYDEIPLKELLPIAYKVDRDEYRLCPECGKRFKTLALFVKHAKLHNEVYDKLECLSCREAHLNGTKCLLTCKECEISHCVHEKYIVEFIKQTENGAKLVKCPDCDYNTSAKWKLIEHASKKHLDNYTLICESCCQSFFSKRSLNNHRFAYHTEKMVCEFCDREFVRQHVKESHERECKKIRRKFRCTECKYSSDTKQKLNKHTSKKHGETFQCFVCNFKALSNKTLRYHMMHTHSGKTLQKRCHICNEIVGKTTIQEHVKTHHNEPAIEANPDIDGHNKEVVAKTNKGGSRRTEFSTCKRCQAVFTSRKERDEHEKSHLAIITCQRCNKQVVQTKYREHMRYHEIEDVGEAFQCDKCDKQFPTMHRLKLHEPMHYEPIQCNICNKTIKYLCFKAHMMRHKAGKDPILRASLKNPPRLKCPKCEHTSYTASHLEAHMNTIHYNRKPHSCDICPRKFAAKYLLNNHLEQHAGTRFLCVVCRQKFASRDAYIRHSRKHHGEIHYDCPTCEERFGDAKSLTYHRNIKHNDCRLSFQGVMDGSYDSSEHDISDQEVDNEVTISVSSMLMI